MRKNGTCPWLRPDGKTQVSVEYRKEGGAVVPIRVHTILISTQHNPDVSNDKIKEDLMEHVIKPVVSAQRTAGGLCAAACAGACQPVRCVCWCLPGRAAQSVVRLCHPAPAPFPSPGARELP